MQKKKRQLKLNEHYTWQIADLTCWYEAEGYYGTKYSEHQYYWEILKKLLLLYLETETKFQIQRTNIKLIKPWFPLPEIAKQQYVKHKTIYQSCSKLRAKRRSKTSVLCLTMQNWIWFRIEDSSFYVDLWSTKFQFSSNSTGTYSNQTVGLELGLQFQFQLLNPMWSKYNISKIPFSMINKSRVLD